MAERWPPGRQFGDRLPYDEYGRTSVNQNPLQSAQAQTTARRIAYINQRLAALNLSPLTADPPRNPLPPGGQTQVGAYPPYPAPQPYVQPAPTTTTTPTWSTPYPAPPPRYSVPAMPPQGIQPQPQFSAPQQNLGVSREPPRGHATGPGRQPHVNTGLPSQRSNQQQKTRAAPPASPAMLSGGGKLQAATQDELDDVMGLEPLSIIANLAPIMGFTAPHERQPEQLQPSYAQQVRTGNPQPQRGVQQAPRGGRQAQRGNQQGPAPGRDNNTAALLPRVQRRPAAPRMVEAIVPPTLNFPHPIFGTFGMWKNMIVALGENDPRSLLLMGYDQRAFQPELSTANVSFFPAAPQLLCSRKDPKNEKAWKAFSVLLKKFFERLGLYNQCAQCKAFGIGCDHAVPCTNCKLHGYECHVEICQRNPCEWSECHSVHQEWIELFVNPDANQSYEFVLCWLTARLWVMNKEEYQTGLALPARHTRTSLPPLHSGNHVLNGRKAHKNEWEGKRPLWTFALEGYASYVAELAAEKHREQMFIEDEKQTRLREERKQRKQAGRDGGAVEEEPDDRAPQCSQS